MNLRVLVITALIAITCMPTIAGTVKLTGQPKDFDVTSGNLDKAAGGRLQITSAEFRAVLRAQTTQNVTVHFTYVGPTKEVFHLNNGEVRSQFGLKLRAKDICNLVYVMWNFGGPNVGINVSVKSNLGQATSQQCRDRGYISGIPARVKVAAPIVRVDEPHTLTVALNGLELTVVADGAVAWQGTLPNVIAASQDGPFGIRADNAHVVFDYVINQEPK